MARVPGLSKSERVGATGRATISLTPSGMYGWTVDQVSVEMLTAPSGAECYLRRNGSMVSPIIPTASVVDGAPAVILNPGDVLTVEWSGCTPGDTAKATFMYDDGAPA